MFQFTLKRFKVIRLQILDLFSRPALNVNITQTAVMDNLETQENQHYGGIAILSRIMIFADADLLRRYSDNMHIFFNPFIIFMDGPLFTEDAFVLHSEMYVINQSSKLNLVSKADTDTRTLVKHQLNDEKEDKVEIL